jgi:hypothetical protein
MPDEPELGPGAAPVKVERPGRGLLTKRKEPDIVKPPSGAQAEDETVQRKPSFKERIRTRYETHKQERAIAKTPEARKKRIAERKEATELTKQELDVRGVERQQKIRGFKESRTGYAVGVAARAAKPVVREGAVQFRRAERRGLGIAPQTAYGTGLTGLRLGAGAQQRYGAPRPGLSAPQLTPTALPIHSMGSISSGGVVSRFEPQRQERQAIPRGTIKSYWSKKVKSLAKANVRKYGADEGIERTRQVATDLGWKMQ